MIKINLRQLFYLLMILFFFSTSHLNAETIKYAVFPAPPYMIGADNEKSILSGIDVEIFNKYYNRYRLKE